MKAELIKFNLIKKVVTEYFQPGPIFFADDTLVTIKEILDDSNIEENEKLYLEEYVEIDDSIDPLAFDVC